MEPGRWYSLGVRPRGRDALGQAVALADLYVGIVGGEELVHLLFQLNGQAVAAAEDALEEAQVGALQIFGPEQGLEERGHARG